MAILGAAIFVAATHVSISPHINSGKLPNGSYSGRFWNYDVLVEQYNTNISASYYGPLRERTITLTSVTPDVHPHHLKGVVRTISLFPTTSLDRLCVKESEKNEPDCMDFPDNDDEKLVLDAYAWVAGPYKQVLLRP